jgi:hypothetical protein
LKLPDILVFVEGRKDGRWEAFTRFFRRRQAVSDEQRRLYIVRVVLLFLGIELNEDSFTSLCCRDVIDWLPNSGTTIGFGFAAPSVQID